MQKTSARLLALLSLLQARRDWPGALLAERLDVSPRTVRRDIDRLRELGYPIAALKGPDGGYRLGAGTELPPLLFDDDQVVALAVALRTAATTGAGIEEDAVRALATVRQVMPARLRHRIDALQITAVTRPGTDPAPQAGGPAADPRPAAGIPPGRSPPSGPARSAGPVGRADRHRRLQAARGRPQEDHDRGHRRGDR
ncbi:helix-turn-helix transcriptional regulator, partial [Streptomyces albidoflavus]|uniref:helix-turn-helix transcriptional regulator n=1 Tax=Streptomyces albidoflavus TaxID=1886 RepID=UPI00211C69AF